MWAALSHQRGKVNALAYTLVYNMSSGAALGHCAYTMLQDKSQVSFYYKKK